MQVVPPRFELGRTDSKSVMLTVTSWDNIVDPAGLEPANPKVIASKTIVFSQFHQGSINYFLLFYLIPNHSYINLNHFFLLIFLFSISLVIQQVPYCEFFSPQRKLAFFDIFIISSLLCFFPIQINIEKYKKRPRVVSTGFEPVIVWFRVRSVSQLRHETI